MGGIILTTTAWYLHKFREPQYKTIAFGFAVF